MRWRRDENVGAPLDGARTPSLSLPSHVSAVRRTGEQVAVRCHVRTKGLVMLPRRNTPPQHRERRPRSHDAALAGVAMPNASPTIFGGVVIFLTPWRRRSRAILAWLVATSTSQRLHRRASSSSSHALSFSPATPSSTSSRFAGLTQRRPSPCRLAGAC
uniref:Uncharacterized protein n=1 Tax=Oryza glaberrima TaxID=4538 RepID=I1PZT5_ORYGL